MSRMESINGRVVAWLRSLERHTKTDMVYLASGGFWAGMTAVLQGLLSFVTALMFANFISSETYGTYQYVLVVAGLFGLFGLSGINTAVTRSTARGMEGSLYDGLRTRVLWGLAGGAGLVLLGGYYLIQENTLLGGAFIIAGVCLPFWNPASMYSTYLQGKKLFKFSFIYETEAQLLATAIITASLFLTKNLFLILAAYYISWGLGRALLFWRTVRQFPPNRVPDPEMVTYGTHLTAMNSVAALASSIDSILLWHLLGPTAVALYTFSQAIPLRATSFLKIFNRLAYPKFAATDYYTLRRNLPKKVFLLTAMAAVASLGYILSAPIIFEWFFPQYIEAVLYSQLLAALIVLQPFNLFSSALSAQAKTKALYIYSVFVPSARIIFMIVLVPWLGVLGAILALIFTDLIDSVAATVLFYRA